MYPATESGRSESGPLTTIFNDRFHNRRASVKHNTASECIRTIDATYGGKILQLYEYDANMYGCDTNCE